MRTLLEQLIDLRQERGRLEALLMDSGQQERRESTITRLKACLKAIALIEADRQTPESTKLTYEGV